MLSLSTRLFVYLAYYEHEPKFALNVSQGTPRWVGFFAAISAAMALALAGVVYVVDGVALKQQARTGFNACTVKWVCVQFLQEGSWTRAEASSAPTNWPLGSHRERG